MSIDPTILEDQQRAAGNWVKWSDKQVGDVVKIVVDSAVKRQATEFGTKTPLMWKDGSPKQELILTGTDPDTGDPLNLVLKWWGNQRRAFIAALDGQPLEPGGIFAIQWTGTDEPASPGLAGAKTWKAQWKPPARSAIAADDLL